MYPILYHRFLKSRRTLYLLLTLFIIGIVATFVILFATPAATTRPAAEPPIMLDFHSQFQSKTANDTGFSASLSTHLGNSNLAFAANDSVQLTATLNKPGYFFVVGYVVNKTNNHAYLLEIPQSNHGFIYQVSQAQAGNPLLLGDFSVSPPYGTEYLQMIASNSPLDQTLPATEYDAELGYHVISSSHGRATESLVAIRGLVRNTPAPKQSVVIESTLTYVTLPK